MSHDASPAADLALPSRNHLGDEASAYLRQHRDNPVHWIPWSPEALETARRADRPLLVSIGYSACHWCHVMAHESFEDPETAALMNQWFVNVKVDREERPDVDQIYMDTVVRLTGHGGWPLTVFCTPDGRPFYAGTYFPPEPRHGLPSFRQLLSRIALAWQSQRDEIEHNAGQILEALAARPDGVAERLPDAATVALGARQVMQGADRENGGFGTGPKFPTPTNLEFLLASLDFLEIGAGREVLQHVLLTCQEMARRGLYDHLGGGFHRYCVDGHWTIPHFEKMLYDQGLLLRVYAEAWRRSGAESDDLVWPIRETAGYLEREMRGPEGAFYASQDADSEGEEGRFYVWTPEQIEERLGDGAEAFAEAYSVSRRGNFENGTTHLVDRARAPRERFAAERAKLLSARSARIAPATDPKRVASWNGYAISGLARAGSLLGDDAMVDAAARAAGFVLESMRDDRGRLLRVYDAGVARVTGFLDDHAALLDACLELHRAGAGDRFLGAAVELGDAIASRFYDASEGDFFLTPADGEPLAHRPRSDHDGATPHATGLAVLGLVRLAALGERPDQEAIALSVLRSHALFLEKSPHAFPTLLRAVALRARGLSVAVIVGEAGAPATLALARRARRVLAPEDAVVVAAPGAPAPEGLAGSWLEGREPERGLATAYVCRGRECSLPVHDPAELTPLPSHA
ncbi:MAG: thioredoxin domain-containing protein [Myxococcota bacterium]